MCVCVGGDSSHLERLVAASELDLLSMVTRSLGRLRMGRVGCSGVPGRCSPGWLVRCGGVREALDLKEADF